MYLLSSKSNSRNVTNAPGLKPMVKWCTAIKWFLVTTSTNYIHGKGIGLSTYSVQCWRLICLEAPLYCKDRKVPHWDNADGSRLALDTTLLMICLISGNDEMVSFFSHCLSMVGLWPFSSMSVWNSVISQRKIPWNTLPWSGIKTGLIYSLAELSWLTKYGFLPLSKPDL